VKARTPVPLLTACIAIGLLATLVAAEPAAAAATAPSSPLVVTFKAFPEGLAPGASFRGGDVVRVDPALRFAVVAPSAVGLLSTQDDPNVLSVEADASQTWVRDAPSDPLWSQQYAPQQVRAPEAWPEASGGPGATICFVDTGVRSTHEDLAGARWLGGWDFVHGTSDPWDDNGHGTHVAGIAAATMNNGKGVAGISQAGFYAVKAIDSTGSGYDSNIASGIRWCADHHATVISMSLGGSGSALLASAVSYAWARGSLLVAAAGNSGPCTDCVEYPAAYPQVVAVTCTTSSRSLCSFSSQGPEAALAAPGYQVLSTWNAADDAYKTLSGTSMSTPAVAGVAALVAGRVPMSNAKLRDVLEANAQDGGRGRTEQLGYGIVDAKASLDAALGQGGAPSPTPTPAPGGSTNQPPIAVVAPRLAVTLPAGFDRAPVALDGTASRDPDGRIVSWTWSENGQVIAQGAQTTVFLGAGTHGVKLTVTDDQGATASATTSVVVQGASAPATGLGVRCAGMACTFSTSAQGLAIWDFGDGWLAFGSSVSHAYARPGIYVARLRVVGFDGSEETWARIVTLPA